MSEPIWITTELTLAIHRRQLAEHGDIAGVRDEGLLSSALARPKHLLAYSKETPDLASFAAAYGLALRGTILFSMATNEQLMSFTELS